MRKWNAKKAIMPEPELRARILKKGRMLALVLRRFEEDAPLHLYTSARNKCTPSYAAHG